MTSAKLDKLILVLYNLCGLALLVVAKTGIGPVNYVPIWVRIGTGILFTALLFAQLWRTKLRKKGQ